MQSNYFLEERQSPLSDLDLCSGLHDLTSVAILIMLLIVSLLIRCIRSYSTLRKSNVPLYITQMVSDVDSARVE